MCTVFALPQAYLPCNDNATSDSVAIFLTYMDYMPLYMQYYMDQPLLEIRIIITLISSCEI